METPVKRKLTREEMKSIVTGGISLSTAGEYKRINKLIELGEIFRIGNGCYAVGSKNAQIFSYELVYEMSKDIEKKIKNHFVEDLRFVIYETTMLNTFLNHLLAHPTIIVEIEKHFLETLFWFLKEEGFQNVLLNPSENENYIYNPVDGTCVIVKPLVSKSPIDNKTHRITIEKLLVDFVCDKTLNMFFEGAEMPYIFEEIFSDYILKFDTIRNYAKRRHCLEKLLSVVPDEYKKFFL